MTSAKQSTSKPKYLSREYLRKIYIFVGPKTVRLFVIGIFFGLMAFGIELVFAFSLQAFLLTLGVANVTSIKLPSFFPQSSLTFVIILLCAAGFFKSLIFACQMYFQQSVGQQFMHKQRTRLLKWAFHGNSINTGEVVTLFTDLTTQSGAAIGGLQALTLQLTVAASVTISLFWLAPKTMIVVLLLIATLYYPYRKVNQKIDQFGRGAAKAFAETNARMVVSIKNILLLKIYGLEQKEEDKSQESLNRHLANSLGYCRIAGIIPAIPQFLGVILVCIIALVWHSSVVAETGLLITVLYLLFRLLSIVGAVSNIFSSLYFYVPQLIKMAKWWIENSPDSVRDTNKKIYDRISVSSVPLQSPLGWRADHIDFSYSREGASIFKNFDLRIDAGSSVVIMGPSGVGKSTLIYLLLGELTATNGKMEVLLDDRAQSVPTSKHLFLSHVGYVGPESFLIDGTIRDNLCYGVEQTPSDTELDHVIRQTECQFIRDLPAGLNHRIDEQGLGLSAGQKQRISLARALLRKPKAIILDEATANLDQDTEARLVDTFIKLKGSMTIVAVTHRPGLLRMADKVIKLGNHE